MKNEVEWGGIQDFLNSLIAEGVTGDFTPIHIGIMGGANWFIKLVISGRRLAIGRGPRWHGGDCLP